MVQTRELRAYDTIDGKAFWTKNEAIAHEETLSTEFHFKYKFKNFTDDDYKISRTWELDILSTKAVYNEGHNAGFLRAYQEDYYSYETYSSKVYKGYGTIADIIDFIDRNHRKELLEDNIKLTKLTLIDFSS